MKNNLNKKIIERYSRQIILKNVGTVGQKTIINSLLPWLNNITFNSPL